MFLINLILRFVYEEETFEIPVFEIPRILIEGHFSNIHLEMKKNEVSSRSREKKKKKKEIVYPCISRKNDSVKMCSLAEAGYYESMDRYYFNPNICFEAESFEYELFLKLHPKVREAVVSTSSLKDVDSLNRLIMHGASENEIQKANKKFYEMQFNEIQLLYVQYQLGQDGFINFMQEGRVMKEQAEYEERAQKLIDSRLRELGFFEQKQATSETEIEIVERKEEQQEEVKQVEVITEVLIPVISSDTKQIGILRTNDQDSITLEEETKMVEVKLNEVTNVKENKSLKENIDEWVQERNYLIGEVLSDMKRKLWKTRKRKKKILKEDRMNVVMVMMILMALDSRKINYWRVKSFKKDANPGDYGGVLTHLNPYLSYSYLKFELFVKRQNTEFKNDGEFKKYLLDHLFEVKWILF